MTPRRETLIGTVTDLSGEELRVLRLAEGSLLMYGDKGTALGFDPKAFAEFRELLDRAAMPGQGRDDD